MSILLEFPNLRDFNSVLIIGEIIPNPDVWSYPDNLPGIFFPFLKPIVISFDSITMYPIVKIVWSSIITPLPCRTVPSDFAVLAFSGIIVSILTIESK